MADYSMSNLSIPNAQVGVGQWRNFSGRPGKFNAAGSRNFNIFLDPETAQQYRDLGWNVRERAPRDENDDALYYLTIKIKYGKIPPKIYLVTKNHKRLLTEDSIGMMDWAEFERVDLIIRPYNWDINGKTGVSAYLKTGYFTLVEDEFADEYADIPADDADVPWA